MVVLDIDSYSWNRNRSWCRNNYRWTSKVGQTNAKVQDKSTETNAKVQDKSAEANTEANKSTNKSKIFKIGDVVKLKDFKVTVNKVYKAKGDEFTQPQPGNEFIAVDCSVENISNEQQVVSSVMMFKL